MANSTPRKQSAAPIPPVPPLPPRTTHTITITYENDVFSYQVSPPQTNPKKTRVRRGDTLQFTCANGDWTVFFKAATPLNAPFGNIPIASVCGAAGATAGCPIGRTFPDANYPYSVIVNPARADGLVAIDDPEIIVDGDAVVIIGASHGGRNPS